MAIIDYTPLEDNKPAKANVWNTRYADIIAQVNGNLDSTNIRAGSLTRSLFAADALLAMWPVGSVYISVSSVNPSTTLGGTWVSMGAGRALVGVDTEDADFNEAEKTSGAKTVSLTEAQMPAHFHAGTTSTNGSHVHSTFETYNTIGGRNRSSLAGGSLTSWSAHNTGSAGSHNHTFTTNSKGSGAAHNNVQPSIAVHFWKRTA